MPPTATRTDAHSRPPALRILASGSAGNCALLRTGAGYSLIDIGLSPRRTMRLLRECGVEPEAIADVLITHLDHDHFHSSWLRAMPASWTLRLHRAHLGRAKRAGALFRRTLPFDCNEPIDLPGAGARALRLAHDSLGVAAFRIECGDRSIGYATDLGRATDDLIRHLAGVGLLAIESNYCPRLQAASTRPAFLKQRITGGAGHLSNHECAEATRRIGARRVVLLHLSRDCNRPELAIGAHHGAACEITASSQHEPTDWIEAPVGDSTRTPPAPVVRQATLFDRATPAPS
jgi:phosphoribosyl 1,2-cyclic phosphodiesterase